MTTTLCGVIVLLLTFVVYYLWRVKAALGFNFNVFNALRTDLLATREQLEQQISRLLEGTQWIQDEFGDPDDSDFTPLPDTESDSRIDSAVEMTVETTPYWDKVGQPVYRVAIAISGTIRLPLPPDRDPNIELDKELEEILGERHDSEQQ